MKVEYVGKSPKLPSTGPLPSYDWNSKNTDFYNIEIKNLTNSPIRLIKTINIFQFGAPGSILIPITFHIGMEVLQFQLMEAFSLKIVGFGGKESTTKWNNSFGLKSTTRPFPVNQNFNLLSGPTLIVRLWTFPTFGFLSVVKFLHLNINIATYDSNKSSSQPNSNDHYELCE